LRFPDPPVEYGAIIVRYSIPSLLPLIAVAVALLPEGAHAQYPARATVQRPPVAQRPTVSPYIHLLRRNDRGPTGSRGLNFALNYHTLVRPQIEFRSGIYQNSVQNYQQGVQIEQLQGQVATQQQGSIRPTGHATTFLNTSHYYGGLQGAPGTGRR
jgi:hypothetical protein